MFYTIYKITNNINGKFYIGKHQTEVIMDSYYGSGIAIVNAIKLHGKKNFTKEILFVFDSSIEMDNKERELITEELVKNSECYNIGIGGEGGPQFKDKKHSAETKEKISASRLGKSYLTEAGAKRISSAAKERLVSDETKKKLSDSAKIRIPQDDECKKRISDSMKEYHKVKKLSQSRGVQSSSPVS